MKKFFLALIIGILVLSGLGAGAINSNDLKPAVGTSISQEPIGNLSPTDYTHTVFVEVGTATWCPSCPASNSLWHTLYAGGNYDFEYVELVDDMNSDAHARFYEFNPAWVPTSYFDAGQFAVPGTNQATFIADLNSAGSRVVPDLVATLSVLWTGSAQMDISYEVQNNDANAYPGKLRMYVLEIESRWNDNSGKPYHHALIDMAKNIAINIPAADSISDSFTWNGAAAGFPDVTQDNVQIILAVFNGTPHTGYSDPPTGSPFNAYYSDECVAVLPEAHQNNPPGAPTIDGPSEGKIKQSLLYNFSAIDPDQDDIASYIINWGDGTGDKTINGPFSSGEVVKSSHTYTAKGTYTISAKAQDVNQAMGPVQTKTVTITKPKAVNIPIYKILEDHPYIMLLLRLMLQQF